jgi:hypothetical protein
MKNDKKLYVPEFSSPLAETQKDLLNSLRFQDQDLSGKLGSLLAFSGLIITSSIVLLSNSNSSIIHVEKEDWILLTLTLVGLILSFASGFITIHAFYSIKKYSNEIEIALIEYQNYLIQKRGSLRISSILVVIGGVIIILALLTSVIKELL